MQSKEISHIVNAKTTTRDMSSSSFFKTVDFKRFLTATCRNIF